MCYLLLLLYLLIQNLYWEWINCAIKVDLLLVKPKITSTPIHYNELAIGPDVTNFTITYTTKSPDNVKITWYHNGVELEERVVSTHHKMGGSSVIQVYQRAHIGEYRVVIESLFNGYDVSEYISQGSKTEYKFMVDVKGEEKTLNDGTM